jgi:holliday junction DNA helicase RuvA
MIAALYGMVVVARGDGYVQLRCGPVVLELQLPAAQARTLLEGEEAELFTHLYLSTNSDQLRLFGFTSSAARELFAALLGGSGIGPKVALALLELGVATLITAIRDGDEKALTAAPGVGPKLAKKIVMELSEKIGKEFATLAAQEGAVMPRTSATQAALDAVVALGYPRLRAEQALAEARREYDGDDPSALIRHILAMLAG